MPGLATLGGRPSLHLDEDVDTSEVTDEQAGCLAETIRRPTVYNQRFVEQGSFVPTGGMRWERRLQIRLPSSGGSSSRWWVLSLGPFNRRRLPDIEVVDAAGEPLNLLTRTAHGLAFSKATFAKEISELSASLAEGFRRPEIRDRVKEMQSRLADYLTETTTEALKIAELPRDLSDPPNEAELHPRVVNAHGILRDYVKLLSDAAGVRPAGDYEIEAEIEERKASFADVLEQALDSTQYLCWVHGRPGEVVNVRVSHTTSDPQHSLKRKTIRSFIWAIFTGLFTCAPPVREKRRKLRNELARPWEAATRGFARFVKGDQPGRVRGWCGGLFEKFADQERRRNEAADWYRRFGLAPINYELNIPTFQHTASYYATIGSPEGTDLTYLDWKLGNSHEEQQREYSETSCSVHPVHIYNADAIAAEDGDEEPEATDTAAEDDQEKRHPQSIRAYFRCKPLHHKQILGAAALNVVFVWLLSDGRLPGRPGDPLQGLVIAAPAILVAFLAQQQQHYYEHALRPSRGILWGYLAVGGAFLVAVAFSGQKVSEGGPGIGDVATVAAWVLAISSVAIFVWHFPLGHMYEHIVGWLYQRRVDWGMETWQAYESAYEHFSQWLWRLVVIAVLITAGVLQIIWDPPDNASENARLGAEQSVRVHQAQVVKPAGHTPGLR